VHCIWHTDYPHDIQIWCPSFKFDRAQETNFLQYLLYLCKKPGHVPLSMHSYVQGRSFEDCIVFKLITLHILGLYSEKNVKKWTKWKLWFLINLLCFNQLKLDNPLKSYILVYYASHWYRWILLCIWFLKKIIHTCILSSSILFITFSWVIHFESLLWHIGWTFEIICRTELFKRHLNWIIYINWVSNFDFKNHPLKVLWGPFALIW